MQHRPRRASRWRREPAGALPPPSPAVARRPPPAAHPFAVVHHHHRRQYYRLSRRQRWPLLRIHDTLPAHAGLGIPAQLPSHHSPPYTPDDQPSEPSCIPRHETPCPNRFPDTFYTPSAPFASAASPVAARQPELCHHQDPTLARSVQPHNQTMHNQTMQQTAVVAQRRPLLRIHNTLPSLSGHRISAQLPSLHSPPHTSLSRRKVANKRSVYSRRRQPASSGTDRSQNAMFQPKKTRLLTCGCHNLPPSALYQASAQRARTKASSVHEELHAGVSRPSSRSHAITTQDPTQRSRCPPATASP